MTTIDEINDGIYRIHTPITQVPGGFSFNQYLIAGEQPLLFHTGPRALAPAVLEAVGRVVPAQALRWIGLAHVESDECGGMNAMLAAAPEARPLCGRLAAMVSMNDLADRPARPLGDGEVLELGKHRVRWLDAPHVPHGWENGFLYEETTQTLFCGDLFTQPGAEHAPIVEGDILGPSEGFRAAMDYYAHAPHTRAVLDRLAGFGATTLACMHGSAWRGDSGALLRALGGALDGGR